MGTTAAELYSLNTLATFLETRRRYYTNLRVKNSRVKQITIIYDYYTTGFGFGILFSVCVPKWTSSSSSIDCCVTVYVFVLLLLLSLLLYMYYVVEVGMGGITILVHFSRPHCNYGKSILL